MSLQYNNKISDRNDLMKILENHNVLSDFGDVDIAKSKYICQRCKQPFSFADDWYIRLSGKVPRILPCKHNICEECILQFLENPPLHCPICFETFDCDSVRDFRYNYCLLGRILCSSSEVPVKAEINAEKKLEKELELTFEVCKNDNNLKCTHCSTCFCEECEEETEGLPTISDQPIQPELELNLNNPTKSEQVPKKRIRKNKRHKMKMLENSNAATVISQDIGEPTGIKKAVKIIQFNNPYSILVSFLSEQENAEQLYEELQMHYSHVQEKFRFWKAMRKVVIYYEKDDAFYRGYVKSVCGNDCDVYLLDLGTTIRVNKEHLRRICPYFKKKYPNKVFECHMANIKPLNAGNEWDLKSIKWFKEILKNKNIYVQKIQDDPNKQSIPVSVWYTDDNSITATSCEYLCVNDKAITEGIALPGLLIYSKHDDVSLTNTASDVSVTISPVSSPESKMLSVTRGVIDKDLMENPAQLNKFDNGKIRSPISNGTAAIKRDIEEVIGKKKGAKIVQFNDPYSMYISFVSEQENAETLHEELQMHYSRLNENCRTWKENKKVVVYNELDAAFHRGFLKSIRGDDCDVYLLDFGTTIHVKKHDLREISPYFERKYPNNVFKCHMVNIKPINTDNEWDANSIKWFKEILKSKDIYVQKVEDDPNKRSIPVSVWYVDDNLVTATTCEYVCLNDKAVIEGIALSEFPIDYVHDGASSLTASAASIVISPSPLLELEVMNEEPALPVKPPHKPKKRAYWLPPDPLTKTEFNAFITCAENKGYLFIREEWMQDRFEEMQSTMQEHFNSIPKAGNFMLHERQMITIKYDGEWYRGTILSVVDKNTAKVFMIDFGSDHEVDISDLHNKVMFTKLPPMVKKVKLYDVHSKNVTWSDSDVDTMLNIISERSRIVVCSSLAVPIPLVNVYHMNGVCFNDQLVEMCQDLFRTPKAIEELDVEDESDLDNYVDLSDFNYVKMIPSRSEERIEVDVMSVYDYRTVSFFFDDVECHDKEQEFLVLIREIQEEADSLAFLDVAQIGTPCLSLFEEDNQWYRAKIVDFVKDSELIAVYYVDYGTFDRVSVSNLRKIKSEWLNFPVRFFDAKLDYVLVDAEKEEDVLKKITEAVDQTKFIEIVKQSPLRVHIFNEDGSLFYDDLLKNNVIERQT